MDRAHAQGLKAYGATLTRDGKRLYVTNQREDTVSVIDPDALTVLQTLNGFGFPEGIATAGDHILVVNWMDETVSVLEAPTGKLLTQVATGRNPRGFGAFIGATFGADTAPTPSLKPVNPGPAVKR